MVRITTGEIANDAVLGLAAGAVASFVEDLVIRLVSGVLIAVVSALVVHLIRVKMEKKP